MELEQYIDFDLLDRAPALDPSLLEQTASAESVSRRDIFANMGAWGKGLAVAAAPIAIGLAASKASAQGNGAVPRKVEAVINFALLLEYLEAEFYTLGVAQVPFPDDTARQVFTIIRDHENIHVDFLKGVVGRRAIPKPNFDFTAGGAFPTVFSDYATFVTLAQGFEDTGVRAYKGQAGNLMPFDFFLTAALTIHSVEARHASKVRRLAASPAAEGWIPFDQPGAGPLAPVYAGEGQTTQGGIDLLNLPLTEYPEGSGINAEAVTEAFDEPLSARDVFMIARMFIAPR